MCSGKKYKRCCANKEAELSQRELPSGRFRYEPGSSHAPYSDEGCLLYVKSGHLGTDLVTTMARLRSIHSAAA